MSMVKKGNNDMCNYINEKAVIITAFYKKIIRLVISV